MKTNVCGIISLIFGITSILLSCVGYGVFFIPGGIFLGIIGIALPIEKKGTAIAGLICSITAIVLFALFWIISQSLK